MSQREGPQDILCEVNGESNTIQCFESNGYYPFGRNNGYFDRVHIHIPNQANLDRFSKVSEIVAFDTFCFDVHVIRKPNEIYMNNIREWWELQCYKNKNDADLQAELFIKDGYDTVKHY